MTSAKHPTAQQLSAQRPKLIWSIEVRYTGSTVNVANMNQAPGIQGPTSLTAFLMRSNIIGSKLCSFVSGNQAGSAHAWVTETSRKFVKYSHHTLAVAPATNTCVRSETQWKQENDQEHRDHCTTKPQTFSRVSLPRWKGVWAQAISNHHSWTAHQAANVSQPMFPNTYFVIIMLFPNDSEVQKDWTRKWDLDSGVARTHPYVFWIMLSCSLAKRHQFLQLFFNFSTLSLNLLTQQRTKHGLVCWKTYWCLAGNEGMIHNNYQ